MRNFCEFFAQIEKDPEAIITGLTIGEYYQAAAHVQKCKTCMDVTERVANRYPDDKLDVGFSAN